MDPHEWLDHVLIAFADDDETHHDPPFAAPSAFRQTFLHPMSSNENSTEVEACRNSCSPPRSSDTMVGLESNCDDHGDCRTSARD
jgi:hypothetical protein